MVEQQKYLIIFQRFLEYGLFYDLSHSDSLILGSIYYNSGFLYAKCYQDKICLKYTFVFIFM
jgi:hypothetical protein